MIRKILVSIAEASKGPDLKTLKKNAVKLADDERQEVMSREAVWHHGPNGEATPAVRKAEIGDETWYWCATHRNWSGAKPTLKGAINAYHKHVKASA